MLKALQNLSPHHIELQSWLQVSNPPYEGLLKLLILEVACSIGPKLYGEKSKGWGWPQHIKPAMLQTSLYDEL